MPGLCALNCVKTGPFLEKNQVLASLRKWKGEPGRLFLG